MDVPLLDLKAQYAAIKDEINSAVLEVLESQHFILGPKVEACERAIADYCRCAHGVGVSSGTDALLVTLMAENIGPGDEVITSPYTFFATAGAIARLGATPVFVDIDPRTYNIDPAMIEPRITERTRAIIPVHLFGQCAEMDPILDVARRHNLVVIEDAAQAIGAEYKGRRAGSMGDYGCFSFFPSKNLGCAGDGGMVTTQDADRAERVRILRAHGSKPKYYHKLVGGNFRLDAIQAAIVTVKLRHLDRWTAARQANAAHYRQLVTARGLETTITLPCDSPQTSISLSSVLCPLFAPPPSRHIYNQFVIRAPQRDALRQHLMDHGVHTEIYYPVPMHRQECFQSRGYHCRDFPESEQAAQAALALPCYAELSDEMRAHVIDSVASFYA
ncbi:MAG: DegT/DnrJ/EryC1/StrS family aminotransferase [Thermoguttaceae bacterium]